jgi:hypothetical protein
MEIREDFCITTNAKELKKLGHKNPKGGYTYGSTKPKDLAYVEHVRKLFNVPKKYKILECFETDYSSLVADDCDEYTDIYITFVTKTKYTDWHKKVQELEEDIVEE